MELHLQNGRPADTAGRLDQLGISYERVDHEAAQTMEACLEIDRVR